MLKNILHSLFNRDIRLNCFIFVEHSSFGIHIFPPSASTDQPLYLSSMLISVVSTVGEEIVAIVCRHYMVLHLDLELRPTLLILLLSGSHSNSMLNFIFGTFRLIRIPIWPSFLSLFVSLSIFWKKPLIFSSELSRWSLYLLPCKFFV